MEGTAKQNLEPVLLGKEGKDGRLAGPSSLTPQGTFLPLQKVGTRREKGTWKDTGHGGAIFRICYSCVPFSDRLVRDNWKQSKLFQGWRVVWR